MELIIYSAIVTLFGLAIVACIWMASNNDRYDPKG